MIETMNLSPRRRLDLTSVLGVTLVAMFLFGVVLPLFDPSRNVLLSLLEGFLIGLPIGILERGLFDRWFRRLAFTTTLVIRTVVYAAIWLVSGLSVFGMVLWYSPWSLFQNRADPAAKQAFVDYYNGLHVSANILEGVIISFAISLAWQINGLLGRGVLLKYVSGRYHRPRDEDRIFMFLDLDSATTLAERLGAQTYSALLRDFFYDLSDEVVEAQGEIVQYVGDELVVSWTEKKGLHDDNCVRLFYLAQRRIGELASSYHEKYGVVPSFKAGVHAGSVVVTEVGKIRREIAYHGDVVNTTARIAATCHELNRRLLLSARVVELLSDVDQRCDLEDLGVFPLRGKNEPVRLFSVEPRLRTENRPG